MVDITELKGLWGRFPCILHKSNPWKTGSTIVYKNTPSSTSKIACYKQKKTETCSEPLSEKGYEVVFHVYHTT